MRALLHSITTITTLRVSGSSTTRKHWHCRISCWCSAWASSTISGTPCYGLTCRLKSIIVCTRKFSPFFNNNPQSISPIFFPSTRLWRSRVKTTSKYCPNRNANLLKLKLFTSNSHKLPQPGSRSTRKSVKASKKSQKSLFGTAAKILISSNWYYRRSCIRKLPNPCRFPSSDWQKC